MENQPFCFIDVEISAEIDSSRESFFAIDNNFENGGLGI